MGTGDPLPLRPLQLPIIVHIWVHYISMQALKNSPRTIRHSSPLPLPVYILLPPHWFSSEDTFSPNTDALRGCTSALPFCPPSVPRARALRCCPPPSTLCGSRILLATCAHLIAAA